MSPLSSDTSSVKAVDDTSARHTARVLNEALPYLQRYTGQTIVIKYGGNAMTDDHLKRCFAQNIVMLKQVGINPVVVHGGGPQIGQMLDKLKLNSEFVEGMRVTDSATMAVVEMVLGGTVNKDIVSLLNQAGGKAVGITGKDSNTIQAKTLQLDGQAKDVLGYVGEVERIDVDLVRRLQQDNFIPVIAPIGTDASGASFNINADLVASAMATALEASRLLLLTNTPGILDKNDRLLTPVSTKKIDELIADGTLYGGMLPKVKCATDAVNAGVGSVVILDGRVEHAVLLELFTDAGVGTLINTGAG